MVGYCHGLPCVAAMGKYASAYRILDPNRSDFIRVFHPAKIRKYISGTGIICHGFGFDHQGSSSSSCCCCCCKVHLYVLKDKVKQVWLKEESFDVPANLTPLWLRTLAEDPCCFCLGNTIEPLTRIFSFSDQVLLYWFNGKDLLFYNLRSGKLHIVMPFSCRVGAIFGAKMKEPQHIYNSGLNDIYSSNMDYQLHCHEENFIPEGVEGVDENDFSEADWNRCTAFVFIYRGSRVYYPSFN